MVKKVYGFKEKQKKCKHNKEPVMGIMWKRGIQRQTMRCPDCGFLLDYIPQYNED